MQNIETYTQASDDFNPKVHVGACYVKAKDKFLFLKLSAKKSEAGRFGVPAGKLDKNEEPVSGAARELFEETGIRAQKISPSGILYFRKPSFDYVYHLFNVELSEFPEIALSEEHESYIWISSHEVNTLNLMLGALEAFEYYLLMLRSI